MTWKKLTQELLPSEEFSELRKIQEKMTKMRTNKFIKKFKENYHIPSFLQPESEEEEIIETDFRLWRKMANSTGLVEQIVRKNDSDYATRFRRLPQFSDNIFRDHEKLRYLSRSMLPFSYYQYRTGWVNIFNTNILSFNN